MNEAETRIKLIDPALRNAGWTEDLIRREFVITEGRLYLVGNDVEQEPPLRADYVLFPRGVPVAVLEAKDDTHHPAAGLQQAKEYAKMLDLQFAYSANGHEFTEFDLGTNSETRFPPQTFPTPDELYSHFIQRRGGERPGPKGDPLLYPYNTANGMHPRYYQDVAIRRAIQCVMDGKQRILLTLATGAGKTFIASQLVWKLYKTGVIRRVLFLADRLFLRDQAYNVFAFFAGPQGDPRHVIETDLPPHYDLYFAIYQGLYAESNRRRLYQNVPPDFFDMVIIDECHRSGFGTWRDILDYYSSAIHVGLTATPKRTDNIDTYAYFGDPVHTYSLGQGIQDGFLATYKVHKVRTNLDERGGVNLEDALIAGAELFVPEGLEEVKEFYSMGEFEQKISLPDWTDRICDHLAATLNTTGPMERTIVFCVNMDHALEVRQRLQNTFAHLGHDDYAVRIVSEEAYAQGILEKFRSSYSKTPVIASTVDLLSTGVDIPSVRNIVLMKPISSVVLFKQIVGRGSRIDPLTNKKWFRIIDYVNATRLFDEWDRPHGLTDALPPKPWQGILPLRIIDAESGADIATARAIAVAAPNDQREFQRAGNLLQCSDLPEREIPVQVSAPGYRTRTVRLLVSRQSNTEPVVVELRAVKEIPQRLVLKGVQVEIANEVILTVDATGRQLTIEQYFDYARAIILEQVMSPEELRSIWANPEQRHRLLSELQTRGVHPELLADLRRLPDADSFDVISNLAFGTPLIRREERLHAFLNRHGSWLKRFAAEQQAVILELLDTYRVGGIEQLKREVLALDRFKRFGGPLGIVRKFGGTMRLDETLVELQRLIYEGNEAA